MCPFRCQKRLRVCGTMIAIRNVYRVFATNLAICYSFPCAPVCGRHVNNPSDHQDTSSLCAYQRLDSDDQWLQKMTTMESRALISPDTNHHHSAILANSWSKPKPNLTRFNGRPCGKRLKASKRSVSKAAPRPEKERCSASTPIWRPWKLQGSL